MSGHTERAHALLSASSSAQWIACPPSARLTEDIPDKRNKYADEGTVAHELAELKLRRKITVCNAKQRREIDQKMEEIKAKEYYCAEMENYISEYVDRVGGIFLEHKARSNEVIVSLEESIDYSKWVPEGFGTGDVVLISDGVVEVIDLKYGKVPVSAIGNPQIRLYALGAWEAYNWLYEIDKVRMTIVQPRLDSITTEELTVKELLAWAEDMIKPAAKLAYAGEGEFKPGDHCRWCKVKGNCRARAEENMKAVQQEFQDPALLSDEEIGSTLFVAQQLKAWAKDVEDYAKEKALSGENIPQWKLVEGKSNRFITDKGKAISKLEAAKIDPDKYLKPRELLGIGALEKQLDKKQLNNLIGDLIVKPQGKPTLVPETDPRPEFNSLEQEFANMDWED